MTREETRVLSTIGFQQVLKSTFPVEKLSLLPERILKLAQHFGDGQPKPFSYFRRQLIKQRILNPTKESIQLM